MPPPRGSADEPLPMAPRQSVWQSGREYKETGDASVQKGGEGGAGVSVVRVRDGGGEHLWVLRGGGSRRFCRMGECGGG